VKKTIVAAAPMFAITINVWSVSPMACNASVLISAVTVAAQTELPVRRPPIATAILLERGAIAMATAAAA
jgi:hypothetical protein